MPTRRTVLATVGSVVAAGGCLDSAAEPPAADSSDPTPHPDETPSGETHTPHIVERECPSFAETDRTVCAHTAPLEPDIVLEPSTTRFEPVSGNEAVETITFTLQNDTGEPFACNPYAWALYRLDDGAWTHVAPEEYVEPLVEIPSGTTYEWVLSREPHPTPGAERTLYPTVEIENGVHAFAVDGWLGPLDAEADERTSLEAIALFETQRVWADPPQTPTSGN